MRGITFINSNGVSKHTYDDFGLLLRDYPLVGMPKVQSKIINVPARDGVIDLSKALDGFVHYNTRNIKITLRCMASRATWASVYSSFASFVHGQNMKIFLDDDSEYYYLGIVEIDEPSYMSHGFDITLNCTVDPYKYEKESTTTPWLWDTFNFETGIIRYYSTIEIKGTATVRVHGSQKPTRPEFTVTGGALTLSVDGGTPYDLPIGKTTINSLMLDNKEYSFVFSGNGVVTIDFRGGSL